MGQAHGYYRHGRHSKYVPARMRETYEQATADPDLLSLRHDIALVDSRLADLLSRVDTGESGALWDNLKKALDEFKLYRRAQDVGRMMTAVAKLEMFIDSGVQDHMAWAEIGDLLEQRRKLAESEHKRLVSLQQLLSTEEALLLMRRVVDIITVHVSDKKALSAIIVDLRQLSGPAHETPVYAEAPET